MERSYSTLIYFTELDECGNFALWEHPSFWRMTFGPRFDRYANWRTARRRTIVGALDISMICETLNVTSEGADLFAEIAPPTMNRLRPELIRHSASRG